MTISKHGTDLGDRLRDEGATAIDSLILDGMEETLHIEFKTLSDPSGTRLNKEDRRLLAKAVCGMANADGGIIIVGIETKRVDNVDVAVGKRLIADPDSLRNRLVAAIPEMLSPQHSGIQVRSLFDSTEPTRGFVAIEVAASDARPHYSNVHHQYFRRGSDGTRVLEHSEIRELMFVAREANLEVHLNLRGDMASGDLKFGLTLLLTLRNAGRVPAIAPYVRFVERPWRAANSILSGRTANGRTGIYSNRDLLIHVEDEFDIAEASTGLDFRRTGQFQLNAAVDSVRQNGPGAMLMAPYSEMPHMGHSVPVDKPIAVEGIYGAENAPIKQFRFDIGKMDLFDLFCRMHGISGKP